MHHELLGDNGLYYDPIDIEILVKNTREQIQNCFKILKLIIFTPFQKYEKED